MELIVQIYARRFSIINMFDEFIKQATSFYEMPAHTLQQMRARQNTKARGDIFEEFCATYLKHVCGYENVWLLSEVPADKLVNLSMKRKDMGIDLVVEDRGSFYAVQCKYKKFTGKPTCVSWQALSTFYALCMRTGPWKKYIVMTNCNFVRHQGKKTQADISICLNTFRGITSEQWASMIPNEVAQPEVQELVNPLTQEELRNRRLAYFASAELKDNLPS
jgi:predicted helicase